MSIDCPMCDDYGYCCWDEECPNKIEKEDCQYFICGKDKPKEERQYDAKKIFNYLKIVRSICNSCNECSKCMFWKEHELYGECILADRNPCDWEVGE